MEGCVSLAGHVLRIVLTSVGLLTSAYAVAQQPAVPPTSELADRCPGLVAARSPRVIPAAFLPATIASDQVRITYAGHSTFLIESPRLVRIATDYNDYVRPPVLPDIVTMNHAHSTHYTDRPDAAIKHVLRGWGPSPDHPARHDMTFQDVRVRNVPTNIRDWVGGGTERHGNSIFIFETAQMCIAHLGHLHHTLNQQQLNEMGRVDVVMVPVDGGATLDLEGMFEVLTSLKASLMIPMHFFSAYTLNRFVSRAKEHWDVEFNDTPSLLLSRTTLPAKPKVLVLPGR
jgi:L-ascorbate metabolism protein UlaG (beta-lactamase superfamily)